jgi:lysozyme
MINRMVVDIYRGDEVTSFADARAAGIVGVIHKATQGAGSVDEAYVQRRQPAVDAGMLWGAYHFGSNDDVVAQVKNFLGAAEPDENTLVALDYEPLVVKDRKTGEKIDKTMTLDQARDFMSRIAKQLGRKPILYSGHLIKDQLGNSIDPFFGSHRLWLAQYGPVPRVQKSWKKQWLWQYTDGEVGPDPKQVPGIPGDPKGRVDCDSYEGTEQQLKDEWAS